MECGVRRSRHTKTVACVHTWWIDVVGYLGLHKRITEPIAPIFDYEHGWMPKPEQKTIVAGSIVDVWKHVHRDGFDAGDCCKLYSKELVQKVIEYCGNRKGHGDKYECARAFENYNIRDMTSLKVGGSITCPDRAVPCVSSR